VPFTLLGPTPIVVRRGAGSTGFVLLPRRWIIEAKVEPAMIRLMVHHLAHPSHGRLPAP
jgi:putative transposase